VIKDMVKDPRTGLDEWSAQRGAIDRRRSGNASSVVHNNGPLM